MTLWLLLRSFAAGCTAMTGVEAVSNGVSAFREPVVPRAYRTLGAICAILGILLAGVSYLANSYGVGAMDQTQDGYQSVLSQLAGAVVGRGIFYYVAIGSVLAILCLSANTSFVDFPRVCRLVAQDDFLPRPFAIFGRRLVFSVGILYLAVTAGLLLIVFGGVTDRLIPLFAIGAFLTFTMSQLGMVFHWRRRARALHARRARATASGSASPSMRSALRPPAVALAIIVVAKFMEGAWITLLGDSRRHRVAQSGQKLLRRARGADARGGAAPSGQHGSADRSGGDGGLESFDRARTAVRLAAVAGCGGGAFHGSARRRYERGGRRAVAPVGRQCRAARKSTPVSSRRGSCCSARATGGSPDRLLQLIARIEKENHDRRIAVLLPQVVKEHWWQYLLHAHRAFRVRRALLRYGGSRLVLLIVPGYLEEPRLEEGLEEEEVAESARQSVGSR